MAKKEKISTAGMTVKEIMKKFEVSKGSAYRAFEQGWLIPDYLRAEVVVGDLSKFDVANATKIAKAVFWKYFSFLKGAEAHKEDCIQEALLRMVELSGKTMAPYFQYSAARNAMRSYLQKQKILKPKVFFREYKERLAA
jgi:hypothetical protein